MKKVKSIQPGISTNATATTVNKRKGYDPGFIQAKGFKITLNGLLKNHKEKLTPLITPEKGNSKYLHYHHFSVAMHKERHMPLLTAVNIDGKHLKDFGRNNDKWSFDKRIPKESQVPLSVYKKNDLDLGHLVRRLDPVWGEDAEAANYDTFHLTVCAPQHKDLNRKTWLNLEDYILKNTNIENLKVSVFTGTVFSDQDIPYNGVLLPLQFFKIAAVIKRDGTPSVTGYLLSQQKEIEDMADDRGLISDHGFAAYKTFQVPLSKIEALTGIHLKPYYQYDPAFNSGNRGILEDEVEINSEGDILL